MVTHSTRIHPVTSRLVIISSLCKQAGCCLQVVVVNEDLVLRLQTRLDLFSVVCGSSVLADVEANLLRVRGLGRGGRVSYY